MHPNPKGGEGIRRSLLMEGDEPTTNYYPDVRTLYELVLRGLRESSEFPPVFTSMLTPIQRCDFRINLGFILSGR